MSRFYKKKGTAGREPNPAEQVKRLHTRLTKQGLELDNQLRAPQYLRLLRRLSEGKTSADGVNGFVRSSKTALQGTAHSLFGERHVPHQVFDINWCSAPDGASVSGKITPYTIKYNQIALLDLVTWRTFVYRTSDWFYLEVESIVLLPYDLRKWQPDLIQRFFTDRLNQIQAVGVRDNTRNGNLFRIQPLERLHQIRRINGSPSKNQQHKIERERIENQMNFDAKFSHEQ